MNTFHPRRTPVVPSTIPPALRHAIRDDIIDPHTARRLAPYLPNPHHQARPEDRVDATARVIGKALLLAGFTIGVLTALTALVALGAWLFRTITG